MDNVNNGTINRAEKGTQWGSQTGKTSHKSQEGQMRKGLIRSQQQVPHPQWYSKLELCFGSYEDFSVNADEAEVSPSPGTLPGSCRLKLLIVAAA